MFSPPVCEKLQHYVYFLQDTRNGNVFYIGKGQGNRIFQHVDGNAEASESDRLDRIREIQDSGSSVSLWVLRHSLNEDMAFELEASLIDFAKFSGLSDLTNIQGGRYSDERGLKTPEELMALYGAEELITSEPVLLFNLNQKYRRGMTASELYEATRTSWVLDKRRKEGVKYAVATYQGLTLEAYEILAWNPTFYSKGKRKDRYEFTGRVAPPAIRGALRLKSIVNYMKKGSANPVKYVNC